MLIVSSKNNQHCLILVITDKNLIGKEFSEGKVCLDLRKEFYQGEMMDVAEVKKLIHKAYIIHFTGKEAVALGLNLNLINGHNVLMIQGIPHAEVVIEG